MMKFINKFKIPTFLGLAVIFLGLISGVYLVLRQQIFLSQAAPDLTPQNITFTNISEDSVVISWQTNGSATSFITYGQKNPKEQTALDDRDTSPKPHLNHYVTLKNLLPKTNYQFKITSGQLISNTLNFETATPLTNQTGFTPVIGTVLDGNTPFGDGIVYLTIQDAITQSSLIKTGGNFLIPLSAIRKSDLSDIFPLAEDIVAKLTIESDKGSSSVTFKLKAESIPLPPIKLNQNLDLTTIEATPQAGPKLEDLNKYDLNNDGKINSPDYAILTTCFNKPTNTVLPGNRSCAKADINGDGKIDQKDLNLMSQKLKDLSSQ